MEARLAKLERIRARSQDPYPPRYKRTHTTAQALSLFQELEEAREKTPDLPSPVISVAGRLVSSRGMGKATFAHIQDGYGRLQLYLRIDRLGEEKYRYYDDFDLGDFIGATGSLFRTRAGEVTLEVADFVILAKSLRPLPEKWHGLVDVEKRYRQRYLDLIANEGVRRVFQVRSRLISSIRRFLDQRGFLEVETPVLQPLYGGAFARPFVTHHHSLDQRMYLRIATELYLKRLIVGGLERVYELGKDFRNEGLSTKHNPEFTVLEAYQSYADYNDIMAMTEEMVSTAAQEVLGSARITFQGQEIDLTPPWRRLTVSEALVEYAGLDLAAYQDPHALAELLTEKGLPAVASLGWGNLLDLAISDWVEPKLVQPTFLMDYPLELSPLAKRKPENPSL
ncbi:MAG: lysine--tRNA ligase, partial [Dehalococcoidia bacterium]|nr:lysine--tRNA ligase [Dehalococcoidia bacterium]